MEKKPVSNPLILCRSIFVIFITVIAAGGGFAAFFACCALVPHNNWRQY